MEIKNKERKCNHPIQVTGQQMYILLDYLEYAYCISNISFRGEIRSNLYKYENKYIVFICCRNFIMDSVQRAKIMEYGEIINQRPREAELIICDDALEKLSLLM